MARRFYPSDTDNGSEQSSQSSVAGIITLQSHRKIGQDPWRPLRPSELSVACENASSTAENLERLLHVSNSTPPTFVTTSPQLLPYNRSTSRFEALQDRAQRSLTTEHAEAFPQLLPVLGTGQAHTLSERQTDFNDRYTELFGKLPDQIHLHEELGEFDGQVVFIGHPNRDVSAHQWSSASFQWESVGRYSHSKDRVEGSLASERVNGIDLARDALLHFKRAAEDREKHVTQLEQPREALSAVHSMFGEIVRANENPHVSAAISQETTESSQNHVNLGRSSGETSVTAPDLLHELVQKEHLDDPFVAKTSSVLAKHPARIFSAISLADAKGSLDLRYRFPAPTRTLSRSIVSSTVQKQDGSGIPCYATRLSQPSLRDVGFGEEASNDVAFPNGQSTKPYEPTIHSSPEAVVSRPKPVARASANMEFIKHSDATVHGRMIPRFEGLNPTARSLFPAPGLTIANPYRNVSRVETPTSSVPETSGKAPELDHATIDYNNTAVLQFSDPDVLRQVQAYEIANGLSQQAPTPQNFKGPFFTESKPTANDPTASLSVHVSDEEKLRNWYRDGHRPARQREYALTLTSAAAAGNRNRRPGTIGGALGMVHNGETKNTTPFIRLYEGFSEYIEEYRNGSGGSYFTRAWKVAPTNLCDLGPDGNNSFFAGAETNSETQHRDTTRKHQKGEAQGFSGLAPSTRSMAFLPYGTVGDRGVGFRRAAPRTSTLWGA
jgi:hypothetical protein